MGEAQDEQIKRLKEQLENARAELNNGFFLKSAGQTTVRVGTLAKRRELRGHFAKVYSIHWAGQGKNSLVSASQDGKLIVWNANSTNKLHAVPLQSCWVMSCAFEQEQSQLVASGGLDNICSVYRLGEFDIQANQRPEQELEGHLGYISCCRFLKGNKIVTSSGDSTCRVWDLTQSVCMNYFDEHVQDVMSVAPHPDNENLFISGSLDLHCMLWDLRTANAVSKIKTTSGINSRYRQIGEDEALQGDEVFSQMYYLGHESDVNSVAFFPDGYAFGTGSDDSTCRLFDLRCHQQVNRFSEESILCGITSVDFSKSGRLLFGGYDDCNMIAWDVLKNPNAKNTDEDTQVVKAWSRHESKISCVSVHSHGKAVATGSWDTSIKVYA